MNSSLDSIVSYEGELRRRIENSPRTRLKKTVEEMIKLRVADFIPILGLGHLVYRYSKIEEPCNNISETEEVATNAAIITVYNATILGLAAIYLLS